MRCDAMHCREMRRLINRVLLAGGLSGVAAGLSFQLAREIIHKNLFSDQESFSLIKNLA